MLAHCWTMLRCAVRGSHLVPHGCSRAKLGSVALRAQRGGGARSARRSASGAGAQPEPSLAARFPFLTQLAVATAKTSACDVMVQMKLEDKTFGEIDWARNFVFVGFGAFYLGGVQYAVYVEGFKRLFPAMERFCALPMRAKLADREGMKQLFQQIGLDFVLIQPALYWPCFYVFKEYLQGRKGEEAAAPAAGAVGAAGAAAAEVAAGVAGEVAGDGSGGGGGEGEGEGEVEGAVSRGGGLVSRALSRYSETAVEDNVGMCGFWLPADLIIYSAPIHLRLILNHGTSFFWTAIVSFFRGAADGEAVGAEGAAAGLAAAAAGAGEAAGAGVA